MSQRQLRGTARARGEEAGGELQHRTQVKPREAGLVEASVLGNATPDIQPWSGRCGGRGRRDIGHSYSKRSLWVRESGRAEGIENDRPTPKEKSDLLIVCAEQRVVQEGSSPSGARMRSAISERGGNASWAGEGGRVWRSLNGHESESRTRAKADLKPPTCNSPEGRVSIARWNPKGMRRSTGL